MVHLFMVQTAEKAHLLHIRWLNKYFMYSNLSTLSMLLCVVCICQSYTDRPLLPKYECMCSIVGVFVPQSYFF